MAQSISTKGIKPKKQIFHNQKLNVYSTYLKFEKILFWPDNFRTVLAFNILEAQKGKILSKITLSEMTEYLVQRPELKLGDLARSIERNGIRVPIIVLDDGTLLDGNRRYFACSYLFHNAENKKQPRPKLLDNIPVWVIKRNDIDKRTQFKILAEANYVPDNKVDWSLDVKATVIYDYFQDCRKDNRMSEEEAYVEIKDVFGEDKATVDAYLESISLTKEFISLASSDIDKQNVFREQVQNNFLYFWEFRNKAMHGHSRLDKEKELPGVKKLFFKMMETDRFKNFKQVEPMIRAVHNEHSWELLVSSQGSKIDQVEVMYKEQKTIRSSEDKIRNFLRWFQYEDINTFSKATIKIVEELGSFIAKFLEKQH